MPLKLNKTNTTIGGIEPLLSEKEAAKVLGLSPASLQRDRWLAKKENTNPKVPFLRLMTGSVRYKPADLRALIEDSTEGA